jgi:hypothetical protein
MANICSIAFNFVFKTLEAKENFILDFQQKMATAEAKNEGVPIAKSDWLFDSYLVDGEEKTAGLCGSVKWALDHETMQEFTEYLRKMNVDSFTCDYEETGNQLYGQYSYKDGELWDSFIDESHSIWDKADSGEDDYFDKMDHVLEAEGTMEQVA